MPSMSKNKSFIFVGHYWGDVLYNQYAKRWINSCKNQNVPYYAIRKHKQGSYQNAINTKPAFILSMLKRFSQYKGIVYMDIDMELKKHPTLFDNPLNVDFMCLNWNYDPAVCENNCVDPYTMETAGGLLYFANNPRVEIILRQWNTLLASKYKLRADDRVLAMLFAFKNLCNTLRVQWLPVEYLYIPQHFAKLKLIHKACVVHNENITSEALAKLKTGTVRDRIPPDYKIQHSVRDKSRKLAILPGPYMSLNKRLKDHGFKFNTTYTLPGGIGTLCTTTGVINFDSAHVAPADIIKLWDTHRSQCDISIMNTLSKKLKNPKDADIECSTFNQKTHKFRFSPSNVHLFLKRNNTNYTVIRHWNKGKDHSVKGLYDVLNSNADFVLRNRVMNTD